MNWLRRRRYEVGIKTQSELALMLQLEGYNVTPASISHWENNRHSVPLTDQAARRALAKVLRMTEPELLALAGYETISSHSEAGERAASIIDQLPEDRKEIALRMLEAML